MDAVFQFLMHWGYWSVFIAGFLSGSILPVGSEAIVVSYIYSGLSPIPCVLLATLGNVVGGATCFAIGHLGKMEWIEKYLRVKPRDLEKAHRFIHGRGAWMAFFSFIPFIGDVLLVALGLLRSNPWIVILAMTLGKLLRYIVVAWGTIAVM
jgi:membrane protein YqaA with SNARE-associated domain